MKTNYYNPVIKTSATVAIFAGLAIIVSQQFSISGSYATTPFTSAFFTPVCIFLSGAGVWLLTATHKTTRQFCIVPALLMLIIIAVLLLNPHFTSGQGGIKNSMPDLNIFCFILMAVAIIVLGLRFGSLIIPAQYALHIITVTTALALLSKLFYIPQAFLLSFITLMDVPVAIILLLLSIVSSLVNYSSGITALFTGHQIGNIMARRLFPLISVVIFILGYLRLQLHWQKMVAEDFGIVLFGTSFILVSILVIAITSKHLNTIDKNRRYAEETLSEMRKMEHEQKLQLLLTSLGDNVWEHDFSSKKTFYYNADFNIAGFTNNSVEENEKHWWNATFEEDRHLLLNNDKNYKAGLIDKHSMEYRLRHKDGSTRWVFDRGVVIDKDAAGKPLRIVGTHTDITQRKKAEAELASAQHQFQSFMEHTPALAWIVDKDCVFRFTNKNYINTFYDVPAGSKGPDLIGKNFYNLFPKEIAAEYKSNNDIVFAANNSLETQEPSIDKNGNKITLKIYKFPLHMDNNVTLLGGIGVDISDHIKKEENLRVLNEKLSISNKELEQFAYIASHDLQEPLRMVSSFMQLLEMKYSDKLDDTAAQYINFAVDGAERMKTLINDLLSFSRIGSEVQMNQMVNTNLVIDEVKLNLLAAIEESGAVIKTFSLPEIQANKIQIVQLFQNLIGNAIKYRSKNKPRIEIGCSQKNNHYNFYIKDNGIGIDDKYFFKIFVIFQRLHYKSHFSGTGVGLSICKKIIEKHGGKISLASTPGTGSTFYFTIPIKN